MIAALVISVLAAFDCDGVAFRGYAQHSLAQSSLADLSGLKIILPVAVFAQVFHSSIPVISQAVRDKSSLSRVFSVSFTITVLFCTWRSSGGVLRVVSILNPWRSRRADWRFHRSVLW